MQKQIKNKPEFWRDERLPHLELRKIEDGQYISYAPHAHKEWSIGAITKGQSTYTNGSNHYEVEAGTLVFMNPHQIHACNPIDHQPWSYFMLYIDASWLMNYRSDLGLSEDDTWQDFPVELLRNHPLFTTFVDLCESLMCEDSDLLLKQSQLALCLNKILAIISPSSAKCLPLQTLKPEYIELVAKYIDNNCTTSVSLDALCKVANCSSGHLIKAFRKHYGFNPHAYLVNRRIQFAQAQLKNGASIAEAALNAGFSDQAHFQRVFKKHVAATPRQYC